MRARYLAPTLVQTGGFGCSTSSRTPAGRHSAEEDIRRIVRSELERAGQPETAATKAAFIASKGTLDWAYPPLILATTAAASGMDAAIFFTFYGLNIIHKDFERLLKVSPVGNPAMPMPVPMPNIVHGMPGMGPMATQDDEDEVPGQERRGDRRAARGGAGSGRPPDRLPDDDGRFRLRAGRLHRRRRVRRARRRSSPKPGRRT